MVLGRLFDRLGLDNRGLFGGWRLRDLRERVNGRRTGGFGRHVAGVRESRCCSGLVLVCDAREAKGNASALDRGLVAQHAALHLPRFGITTAFRQVFGHAGRMGAVLAVDDRRAGNEPSLFVVLKLVVDAVELRMVVHHPNPAVDGDNRHDAAPLRREGVNLLRERIQAILVRDNNKGQKLVIRGVAENGVLEGFEQFGWLDVELASHDGEGRGLFLGRVRQLGVAHNAKW